MKRKQRNSLGNERKNKTKKRNSSTMKQKEKKIIQQWIKIENEKV